MDLNVKFRLEEFEDECVITIPEDNPFVESPKKTPRSPLNINVISPRKTITTIAIQPTYRNKPREPKKYKKPKPQPPETPEPDHNCFDIGCCYGRY